MVVCFIIKNSKEKVKENRKTKHRGPSCYSLLVLVVLVSCQDGAVLLGSLHSLRSGCVASLRVPV